MVLTDCKAFKELLFLGLVLIMTWPGTKAPAVRLEIVVCRFSTVRFNWSVFFLFSRI